MSLLVTIGAAGVVLSVLAFWLLRERQYGAAEKELLLRAQKHVDAIESAFTERLSTVQMLVAFYAGSQSVERAEFHSFTEQPLSEYPDMMVLGWVRRVSKSQRVRHEEEARSKGLVDYRITERDEKGELVPAGERDEYFPIDFVEPGEGNEALTGFDLGSVPACREALRRANASRGLAAAEAAPLLPDPKEPYTLYGIAPAYNHDTSGKGRLAVGEQNGFLFGTFRVGRIVKKALSYLQPEAIDIFIYDTSAAGPPPLLFAQPSPLRSDAETTPADPAGESDSGLRYGREITVGDRKWLVSCVPLEAYLAKHRTLWPGAALAGGLLLTAVLVGCVGLLFAQTARVERLVAKRTAELHTVSSAAFDAVRKEQRLLHELLNLHERERKLVAYEIHDGLAQQLTGAVLKFQASAERRAADPARAESLFQEALRLLSDAMAETRRLISGLRPPVLDDAGIVPAIESLVAEWERRGGPQIELSHDVHFDRLAQPLENAVFRVVQECLTNAARHSQSQHVRVELLQEGNRLRIDVQDWGVGFDPKRVAHDRFGLRGIRERARLLGGTATIQSAPGTGTQVTVELPLLGPGPSDPEMPAVTAAGQGIDARAISTATARTPPDRQAAGA